MANYTYTTSTAQLREIDREVRLPRQIPHVANLGVTYDLAGFQGALTTNHRSEYLFEVNNLMNTPQTWYDGHPDFHYRSSYNQRWGLVGFRYGL